MDTECPLSKFENVQFMNVLELADVVIGSLAKLDDVIAV